MFANGQSVQSTVVPRRPGPVDGLGKAGLQSYRPWEQQFGLTIVRLQSTYKYRDCYLKKLKGREGKGKNYRSDDLGNAVAMGGRRKKIRLNNQQADVMLVLLQNPIVNRLQIPVGHFQARPGRPVRPFLLTRLPTVVHSLTFGRSGLLRTLHKFTDTPQCIEIVSEIRG